MSSDEVRFNRADERSYGAFSNLYRRPFQFQGREFPTAEHAYQFGKPRKPAVRDWLMAAPSPSLLAMAAHGLYTWDVAPGWSRTKLARMRCVLGCKFWQHADLRDLLVGTGAARIVEAATVDNDVNRFWGEVNGRGQNHLGLALMGIREDLRCGIYTEESMRGMASGIEPDGSFSPWYCGQIPIPNSVSPGSSDDTGDASRVVLGQGAP